MTRRARESEAERIGVAQLNRKLTGWATYFCLGPVSQAYRAIDERDVETGSCIDR